MQEQIRNHAESTWLIHTEEVQISLEEYVMAKNNKALIWALNELEEKPSDDEQLQEMIADRLLASHAKQSGIEVTPDEVHEALDQQRTMLRAVDVTDPNHQAILYIMEQRLLMTGLSEEEFWNSEEVYNSYEQSLYITKLSQQIRSDGNLKGMNSYDELRDQLLTDFMNSRTIEVPDLSEFV
ncbi:hypothetical protein JCM10914_1788 [Paenibacillus sp. JCM 10914]|nr:hypothetical protein JCM10914_1788 [Paenibacillus sp. JCM 10914]